MSRVFENAVNQYIIDLKNQSTLLEGSIVGINEILETAQVKVSIIVGEEIKEKYIFVYKSNDVLTWKFFNQADNVNLYDFSSDNWHYPSFSKRIITPIQLLLEYSAFEVWFRMNNLPIYKENDTLYCYCNEILPEHQYLIDNLSGTITVENKPL